MPNLGSLLTMTAECEPNYFSYKHHRIDIDGDLMLVSVQNCIIMNIKESL